MDNFLLTLRRFVFRRWKCHVESEWIWILSTISSIDGISNQFDQWIIEKIWSNSSTNICSWTSWSINSFFKSNDLLLSTVYWFRLVKWEKKKRFFWSSISLFVSSEGNVIHRQWFLFLAVRSSMHVALCTWKITLVIHIFDEQFIGERHCSSSLRRSIDRSSCFRIILNLICFIAPIGSLRSVSETLFQRLCLSQTPNERSDLLIVLNEVKKQNETNDSNQCQIILGHYQSFISRFDFTAMDSFEWTDERRRFEFISKVKQKIEKEFFF